MAPRVKLGDLSPAEKERMMAFLVANQVEFKPDISGNFTAVLKLGQAKAEPKVEPKVEKMEGCQGRSDIASSAPVEEKVLEVAAELKKRFPSFTALLPNITQHPKTMLKAELIGFVEEVYTARYNQDLLQVQRHAEAEATGGRKKKKLPTELTTFPQSVLTAAGKRYGLPQMVGQVCWSLVKSVDQFRAEHEGIEIFARFLEESYDAIDLLFYLEMRWAARQMTMPRGTWTSWRSRPQAFSPQERFLGNNVDSTSTSASKSSPSRPQLTLKQASAAVREGIDPEAPEALKAQILNRLKAEGGHQLDWDHFLFICTQEYRRARRAARGLAVAPPGSASARQAQRFARLLRQAWRLSVPEAFERFTRDGSHLLSAENFKQVATGELGLKAARAEELWRLLDGEKRGFIEQEEWNLLDVQEAPSEEPVFPPGWDSKLSVSESEAVQGEAKQVAARLAAYLEEHGEEVDENEVLRWALRSVLQRREAPPQASLEPMSLEVHGGDEQKLEATVREHLASATGKLVEKALGAANNPEMKAVREALIEEFMPITDALMEAVVIGDLTAWQTRLNAFEQEKTFKELSEEFQRLLTDEASTEGLVSLVCNVAGAEGLQAMCRARGLKLMEERGLPLPSFEDPEVQDRSLPIDDAF